MLVTMTHNQVEALLEERVRNLTKTYRNTQRNH
jgi:hypothetical protein